MSQPRFLSALLCLTAFAGSLGMSSVSYAADVPAANPTTFQTAQSSGVPEESTDRTIYVTGISEVNAPADQAVLILSYYSNSYASGDYSDPNATTQMQVQPSDLSAAVNAATGAGVAPNNVKAYPDLTSPGSMRVRIVIDQPSQDKIQQVIDDVNTVIIKGNRFVNGGAVAAFTVQDCRALEGKARQAAMADAQQRSAALAEVAGVGVGRVVNLSESVTWGSSYSSTCPTSSNPMAYIDTYSMPTYDPTLPPLVRLVYNLSVTYGLR